MLKRKRGKGAEEELEEAADPGFDPALLPSDTQVGIEVLKKSYPQSPSAGKMPIVFVSQLYAIVSNRTQVDQQLNTLATSMDVRMMKTPGQFNDTYLLSWNDYLSALDVARKSALAYKKSRFAGGAVRLPRDEKSEVSSGQTTKNTVWPVEEVIERFKRSVLPGCTRPVIALRDLRRLLALPLDGSSERPEDSDDESGSSEQRCVKEAITVLQNAGLLIRRDDASFLFAVPVRTNC
mmetsp:Transcript_28666/g.44915  ORF Transcript_28666/g.44915 Transcript_28666/m.44915 type:complete len:236 (-) Transcript_28666:282-989(-)